MNSHEVAMAPIVLEGVTKVYPDGTTAVRDIDLTVQLRVSSWCSSGRPAAASRRCCA